MKVSRITVVNKNTDLSLRKGTQIFLKRKFLSAFTAAILLVSAMVFPASAIDQNESENNNTASTADITYDNYTNYGAISSSSDVDWWKITFSQSGSANFWLGNIPSG